MRRSDRLLVLATMCAMPLLGCDRHIDAGSIADDEDGGAASAGQDLPSTLVFESRFETGELGEWGESGETLTTPGGSISVQDAVVHGGTQAALFSTTETGEHVVLAVEGDWTEVLIGFWLRAADLYTTQNWPILHVDGRGDAAIEQLWDVGLDASSGDGYQVFLWEMPAVSGAEEPALAAISADRIAPDQWAHVQVHLYAAPDDTGFIRVLLDGRVLLDLSQRVTGNGDPLRVSLGSFAFELEPRPADLFFDDVTVHVPHRAFQ